MSGVLRTRRERQSRQPASRIPRAASLLAPLALLLAALAFAAPASAAELVSNTGQSTGSTTLTLGSGHWHAQRFTTGANTGGYTLTDVELDFNAGPASGISVQIVSGLSTSSNGTGVATLNNPTALSAGTLTFTAPANTTLDASTQYAVVVNGGAPGVLRTTSSHGESGATGWTIANGRSWRSGTANYTHHSASTMRIRVNGAETETDTTAPTFSSATVNGTSLVITFSEAMNPAGNPVSSAFRVVAGTSGIIDGSNTTRVTIDGDKITATLASAVVVQEAVLVEYRGNAHGFATKVRDLADNNLGDFASKAATNLTGQPTLSSATVNGATLTLNYNEALNTGSTPATTDFTVSVAGTDQTPTGVSVAGNSVTLTLGTAATSGQTVTVSYTAGTNPIQDRVGVDAADLSSEAVTNVTGDTTAPTISGAPSVTSNPGSDNTYAIGDTISVKVTFNENVTVTGTPQLELAVGASNRQADYASGSSSTELTFSYTVVAGDEDSDGISVAANKLTLNGGTIKDAADNDATLTHGLLAAQSGHKVDGVAAPTLESAVVNGTSLKLNYNEALDTGSTPATSAFSVSVAGTAQTPTGVAVSGQTVTLTLGTAATAGQTVTVSYTVPGTNPIQNMAGRDADALSSQAATNVTGDTTGPTLDSAVVEWTFLTLTYNEPLDTGSTPATTDFTVSVAGTNQTPSKVEVSGKTVKLRLGTTATAGQTVTVSYTKPATNPIQDLAGNDAAALTNQSVTNDTPVVPLPVAQTGADREVIPGAPVTLDGSASTAPLGATMLDYAWSQTAGPAVTLNNANTARASFTAPASAGALTFRLTVTARGGPSNGLTATDDVTLTVGGAPTLKNAVVNGTSLRLNYNEALDTASVPAKSAFTVSVAGTDQTPTGVAVSGQTVTLTLGTAATAGQTVTVSYTVPGTNPIQDSDGNDAGALSSQAATNVTGDTTVPTLSSATVDRTTLRLNYSEALDTTSVPATTDFTVSVAGTSRTLSNVEVSGSAVTLTLSPAATHGQTVTVSYTVPATNPIEDWAGNNAAALTNEAVTNNTRRPVPPPAPSVGATPVADAGADLAADPGEAVTLDGSGSSDPDGDTLSFAWSQTSGEAVTLSDADMARATFTAPETTGDLAFRLTVTDPGGLSASAAVTVTVRDPHTAAVRRSVRRTLAAVARRALTSALDNIGARFAASLPMSGMTLAGEMVPFSSVAGDAEAAPACTGGGFSAPGLEQAFGQNDAGPGDCAAGVRSRSMETEEILRTSGFSLALGAAEGSDTSSMPLWSVWGRGDLGTFAGRPEPGMRYEGELQTGWLGIDARSGAWVAGLAVSHGTGEADYSFDAGGHSGEGRLETTLTALYPYARLTVSDGLELRGVLGVGNGEARHWLGEEPRETGDLTMQMGSLGLRQELPALAGIALAVRADASLARLETEDGPDHVDGLSADSTRLRAGLEASRRLALDGETALTPFVEAAARRDGGDGLTGTGLEVVGGLRYEAPRLQVEARGRWLAAHTEEGVRESGVSVTARVGPGAHGRGLSLSLSPRWGAGTGSAQALWGDKLPNPAGASVGEAAALDARLGYGLGVAPYGLLTPFAETGLAGEGARRLRLGTRFEAGHTALGVELSGERVESGAGGPVHALRLDARLRF